MSAARREVKVRFQPRGARGAGQPFL